MAQSDRSSDDVERELAHNRAAIDETLTALEDRLSPTKAANRGENESRIGCE